MKQVGFLDAGIQVALEDVRRQREGIVKECLKVWDSMTGKLPPFCEFCTFYINERFDRWLGRARWN